MLLYLDDDSVDGHFIKLLRKFSWNVETPAEAGRSGNDDPVHLRHAILTGRVLLTHNRKDFKQLHDLIEAANGSHPGILMVRKDNDKRDMKPAAIAAALKKFADSGNPIASQFVILNDYR